MESCPRKNTLYFFCCHTLKQHPHMYMLKLIKLVNFVSVACLRVSYQSLFNKLAISWMYNVAAVRCSSWTWSDVMTSPGIFEYRCRMHNHSRHQNVTSVSKLSYPTLVIIHENICQSIWNAPYTICKQFLMICGPSLKPYTKSHLSASIFVNSGGLTFDGLTLESLPYKCIHEC